MLCNELRSCWLDENEYHSLVRRLCSISDEFNPDYRADSFVAMNAKERFMAFRRARPRPPRLERRTVHARGLDFAVWASPRRLVMSPALCEGRSRPC